MDSVSIPKLPRTLNLTRAGLYLLEGCLQEMGPCTIPQKVVLTTRVWQKVRAANDRTVTLSFVPGGHDIEKPLRKAADASDQQWQDQIAEWNASFKAWQETPVILGLSNKHFDCCRDAVKWVFDNKDSDRAKAKLDTSIHSATLLVALGLADAEPDDA